MKVINSMRTELLHRVRSLSVTRFHDHHSAAQLRVFAYKRHGRDVLQSSRFSNRPKILLWEWWE